MTIIIRTIAALAAIAMLAFMPTKASARGCSGDRDNASCAAPAAPVQLDQFMKTWKPVGVSTSAKRTRSVRRHHRNYSSSKVASERRKAGETRTASVSKTDSATTSPAAVTPPPPEAVKLAAAEPDKALETDGVAVTSFNEANELDQSPPRVQVVAFNDVNEIDLAAPPPLPVAAETVSQAASKGAEPADNSWIGKLLLAAAATIALAGGARMLAT